MDLKNRKVIKDFKIALKDLKPMVEDPSFLWRGRDLDNFSLRPREIVGNWLVCVVLREMYGDHITFMDDKEGDGFLVDLRRKLFFPTEHVCALDIPEAKVLAKGEQRVIDAINLKISRGPKYAKGKLLIVFFDGAGRFFRNKIREAIYGKHNFEAIFCVGLLEVDGNGYNYSVTEFRDSFGDHSITHKVTISKNFDSWEIDQIMY